MIVQYTPEFQRFLMDTKEAWRTKKFKVSDDLTIADMAVQFAIGMAMTDSLKKEKTDDSGYLMTLEEIWYASAIYCGDGATDDDTLWIKAGLCEET